MFRWNIFTKLLYSFEESENSKFIDDFDIDTEKEKHVNKKKSEEEIRKQKEEEAKEKENKTKQDLLNHSEILVKELPKSPTYHTSYIHDSYIYIIGGIDYYFSKEKSKIYYLPSTHRQTANLRAKNKGRYLG